MHIKPNRPFRLPGGQSVAFGVLQIPEDGSPGFASAEAVAFPPGKDSGLPGAERTDGLLYGPRNNVAILAYSPPEQGLLPGKIGMDRTLGADEFRNRIPWFLPANRARVLAMLDGWRDLCAAHACTTGRLVLVWTVAQPGLAIALCGARTVAQAFENAKAGGLALDAAALARMRADVEALGAPAA
jgi:aryl-alcohol dehydrogenase-like predicted oxidoreductase